MSSWFSRGGAWSGRPTLFHARWRETSFLRPLAERSCSSTYCRGGPSDRRGLSLRRRDIIFDDLPRIRVITEKTSKPRVVFLPPDLAARMKEHIARLSEDDYVFHVSGNPQRPLNPNKAGETFRRALFKIDRLRRDASGRGYVFSLHSFSRSYETTPATAGVHLMTVKALLGHSQCVEDSYLRLDEKTLYNEWKKAAPLLRLDAKEMVPDRVRELEEMVK